MGIAKLAHSDVVTVHWSQGLMCNSYLGISRSDNHIVGIFPRLHLVEVGDVVMVSELAELLVHLSELIRLPQQRLCKSPALAPGTSFIKAGVDAGDVMPIVLVGALVWCPEERLSYVIR